MKHELPTGSPISINQSSLESELRCQDQDRSLASYDYELPAEQIAQNPAIPRDSARLLVVNSSTYHTHSVFHNLPDLLQSGDLLVLNNTRVIPARLYGRKTTGAPVEILLMEEQQQNCWLALVKPGRRLKPGAKILFERHGEEGRGRHGDMGTCGIGKAPASANSPSPIPNRLSATVLETDEATGGRLLQFDLPEGISLVQILEEFGQVPLPPYITDSQSQMEQYQTVYAEALRADSPLGIRFAIAAPTAGLHFTPELLSRCNECGIGSAFVTLHVGVGTFRPVEVEDITAHKMHGEWVEVPIETVEQIRATQSRGGRVIAVGTTVTRALESAAQSLEMLQTNSLQPYCGKTELFIYPGYRWRVVEGLITNFHLPRSSLLMLVSALIGRQRLLDLYQEAIRHQYRFYSFGDAMLILPEAKIG